MPRHFLFWVLIFCLATTSSPAAESSRFKVGCLVLGTVSSSYMNSGQTLLKELNFRTQVDPDIPAAWKKMDSSLKGSPPFLWLIIGPGANIDKVLMQKLQRFMASGGTVLAEADGSPMAISHLKRLRHQLFSNKKIKRLKDGSLLTRTFYIVPTSISNSYKVLLNSGRLVWIESDRSLLLGIGSSGMSREYSIRMGINIVLYTLTGSYKDDLTHLRYLMRRKKQ